jgi:hypothetical protein
MTYGGERHEPFAFPTLPTPKKRLAGLYSITQGSLIILPGMDWETR